MKTRARRRQQYMQNWISSWMVQSSASETSWLSRYLQFEVFLWKSSIFGFLQTTSCLHRGMQNRSGIHSLQLSPPEPSWVRRKSYFCVFQLTGVNPAFDRLYESLARKPRLTVYRAQQVGCQMDAQQVGSKDIEQGHRWQLLGITRNY